MVPLGGLTHLPEDVFQSCESLVIPSEGCACLEGVPPDNSLSAETFLPAPS